MSIKCGFVLYDNDGIVIGAIHNNIYTILSSLANMARYKSSSQGTRQYRHYKLDYINRAIKLINSAFSNTLDPIVVIHTTPDIDCPIYQTLTSLKTLVIDDTTKATVQELLAFNSYREFEKKCFS